MRDLDKRIKNLETKMNSKNELLRKLDEFNKMTDAELERFFIKSIVDDIKSKKNVLDYHNIKITEKGSYTKAMQFYINNYIPKNVRHEFEEIYTDEHMEYLEYLFETNKEEILRKI